MKNHTQYHTTTIMTHPRSCAVQRNQTKCLPGIGLCCLQKVRGALHQRNQPGLSKSWKKSLRLHLKEIPKKFFSCGYTRVSSETYRNDFAACQSIRPASHSVSLRLLRIRIYPVSGRSYEATVSGLLWTLCMSEWITFFPAGQWEQLSICPTVSNQRPVRSPFCSYAIQGTKMGGRARYKPKLLANRILI